MLCYLSGLTRDEAAERLGWSLGTLKRRLEQGRTALRKRLEQRGITSAGLALAVLSPAVLDAAVCPALTKSCLDSVIGNQVAASTSALLLTSPTTLTGIAMKIVIVSLAFIGMGMYATLGRDLPAKPTDEKKMAEPTAAANKVDRFDDPLPAGTTMRLGTSRYRQGVHIVSMAVSADGKTAFVCSGTLRYGCTRAFDLLSGRPLFTINNDAAEALVLSPDGRFLVSKAELTLHVRDAKTGHEVRTIALPKTSSRCDSPVLAFTPDGKTLATTSNGKIVHLIDFETGKLTRDIAPAFLAPELGESFQTVLSIAFSPDGKQMASAGFDIENNSYFARLWDVETGKELRRFQHGKGSYGITHLAFSPDGKILATGAHDGALRLFDVDTGIERKPFPIDGSYRNGGPAFTPDAKTVAFSGSSIQLYDTTTGVERLRIDRRASYITFTDHGKTLTGAVDGAIYRWDASTGKPLTPVAVGDGVVHQILVTPDGSRIFTRTQVGTAQIWDGTNANHQGAVQAPGRRP